MAADALPRLANSATSMRDPPHLNRFRPGDKAGMNAEPGLRRRGYTFMPPAAGVFKGPYATDRSMANSRW